MNKLMLVFMIFMTGLLIGIALPDSVIYKSDCLYSGDRIFMRVCPAPKDSAEILFLLGQLKITEVCLNTPGLREDISRLLVGYYEYKYQRR